MKQFLAIVLLTLTHFISFSQVLESDVDTVALVILDRMSSIIGDLESCSFSVEIAEDTPDNTFFVPEDSLGLIKQFTSSEVYMVGPDKLLVNSNGDNGHRGFWYNGSELAFYSYDYQYYALLDGEANILDMIYQVSEHYDVDFPAADFFNPYFTDDLLEQSQKLKYLGTSMIDGTRCFHIISSNSERNVQIWITDDALALPKKMVIVSYTEDYYPQYEITFDEWELNPSLPASLFDFVPPPNAVMITMVPKSGFEDVEDE